MRASSLRGTGRDLAEYFLRCACLIGAFLDGIVRHDNGAGRAGFMCFLKAVKTVLRSLSCGWRPFLGGNLWKSEVQIVGPVSSSWLCWFVVWGGFSISSGSEWLGGCPGHRYSWYSRVLTAQLNGLSGTFIYVYFLCFWSVVSSECSYST